VSMKQPVFTVFCEKENAPIIDSWIKTRKGILLWKSVNLSNPEANWITPCVSDEGKPYTKPTWQSG
jgi:hypothetical protein